MSKSLGNVVSPEKILKDYGVDILRLWVVASDYYDDLKLDNSILKAQTDSYRRIRNTFRYLIGNLNGFNENEKISFEEFPELEKYILHRLWEVDHLIEENVKTFNFHQMFTTLFNFCSNDLSAFYFDIRKDVIYCDSYNSIKRKASRSVLDIIFNHLVRWLAPILVFTCEEAWKSMGKSSSVHLENFLKTPNEYKNENLNKKWSIVKNIRKVITGALEKKRADKLIGSSLEAHIKVYLSDSINQEINNIKLDDIAITSSYAVFSYDENSPGFKVEDIAGVSVEVENAHGKKCNRCWKYSKIDNNKDICNRCEEAIK